MNSLPKTQEKVLTKRPPIVVVLGHVNHGKSTLLDYIRKTNIAGGEAGGITQHIGAYEVAVPRKSASSLPAQAGLRESAGDEITFIDTPGHEAFSAMRSRGAQVADIAVLVVAADDGVKAQTLEALQSIKAAEVPFIVAINKIDKPGANPDLTKQQLAEAGVLVEGYGGDVPAVAISAKTGQNIDELLEMILLVWQMSDLKAHAGGPAEAVVLESHLDPKKGVTATLIIRDGKLQKGDWLVTEGQVGRTRILEDFLGRPLYEAGPGRPLIVIGFNQLPAVGAQVRAFADKDGALEAAEEQKKTPQPKKIVDKAKGAKVSVPTVLKADTTGTLEAVIKELRKLESEKTAFDFMARGIGNISEADTKIALAAEKPLVVGFNVKVDKTAAELADAHGIKPQIFDVIYKLTEWAAEELERRRPRSIIEEPIGEAKIIRLFSKDKSRQIVGGRVSQGKLERGKIVKILRRGEEVGRGRIKELQRNRAPVDQVETGAEFGAAIESKMTAAQGDIIVAFDTIER